MDVKKLKIVYWIITGIMSAMLMSGAVAYFVVHDTVAEEFAALGYPEHLIYPLAIFKIAGIGVILSAKQFPLREWAYAGFFFNLCLAALAHINAQDGEFGAFVVMGLLLGSYFLGKKVFR